MMLMFAIDHWRMRAYWLTLFCLGIACVRVEATPSAVLFATNPGGPFFGGETFGTAPVVHLLGSGGAVDTSATDTVTISILNGPAGSTVGGTASMIAASGVADFSAASLTLDLAGTYVLKATIAAGGGLYATTQSFVVQVGSAYALTMAGPSGSITGGVPFPVQPIVYIVDRGGNTVTSSSSEVTISKNSGPGTLSGSISVTATGGVADFAGSDLRLDIAGDYTLHAQITSPISSSITSSTISVAVGPPSTFAFDTEPSTTNTYLNRISTPPVIHLTDAGGNVITSNSNDVVFLTKKKGRGSLYGETSMQLSSGIADYSSRALSVDRPGTYALEAVLASDLSVVATSNDFDIAELVAIEDLVQARCIDGTKGFGCTERMCPRGIAWVDRATADNVAHGMAECSNKGICNRDNGLCECADGFEGHACQRALCPSINGEICGGRGRCMSIAQVADASNVEYGIWDSESIFGCICDVGWTGYDCSIRGGLSISLNGEEAIDIPFDATTAYIRDAIQVLALYAIHIKALIQLISLRSTQALPSYPDVVVTMFDGVTVCDNDGVSTAITFTHNPGDLESLTVSSETQLYGSLMSSSGSEPVLAVHTGGATGSYGGTSQDGTKENLECSNRGTCNTATGACSCFAGFDSSDGAGNSGMIDNCGYMSVAPTACGGTDPCGQSGGKGVCDTSSYTCICASGYEGVSCERRACPSGKAWFNPDVSSEASVHASTTCSNNGLCQTGSGTCTCKEGFSGTSCEQMRTIADFTSIADSRGEMQGFTYTLWDEDVITGCECDYVFTGPLTGSVIRKTAPFCSDFQCPFGDDVSTFGKTEIQEVMCYGTSGHFLLNLGGSPSNFSSPISVDATESEVAQILQEMLSHAVGIDAFSPVEVSISFSAGNTACSAAGVGIRITFSSMPGDLPALRYEISNLDSGTGRMAVYEIVKGTKENVECGNHGRCNRKSGFCNCEPGFGSSNGQGNVGNRGDCGAYNRYRLAMSG